MHTLLEQLRSRHARYFGWSLICCGWQREVAEDVLQEAYLRVLDGRANFAGNSSLSTGFCGVIKRVAGESGRRQRRLALRLRAVRAEAEAAGAGLQDDSAAMQHYRDQRAQALRSALLMLSTRQREVLHLVFYSDMTIEEAAQVLRISLGSARTHYQRGKQRLAQVLEQGGQHVGHE